MTPTSINSSSSSFHGGSNGDQDQHHQFFGPSYHQASSSSYLCDFYFNSTQDQAGYYNHSELYRPQQQLEGKNDAPYGGSYELSTNKEASKYGDDQADEINRAKWMSSKMRLMQKMKSRDINGVEITSNATIKREDHKKQSSLSMGIDCRNNCSSNSSNTPIRVCADCNTTKTPLWRSGPKGPKSLCNACGIRQRKARRAMAAAAAAADDPKTLPTKTPPVKIKIHHKEQTKKNGLSTVPFKKRCKVITAGPSEYQPKKLGSFEEYLINLSKNLAFHHVFPQDEKEAAILLMALSCGLVHG